MASSGVGFTKRLLWLQLNRPVPLLLAALVLTVVAVGFASTLRVQTGFESLLPESRDSVKELRRVAARTQGVSTVYVVLEGGPQTPVASLRAAADTLVTELEKVGEPYVSTAESGVQQTVAYLGPRSGLYLSLEKLEALEQKVSTAYGRAVGKATGLLVDLDEEEGADAGTTTLDLASIKQDLAVEGVDPARYPDGYYQSADGRALVVLVRSKVAPGEFDKGSEAIALIKKVVEDVDLARYDPALRAGYSGDLVSSVAEFEAVNNNLVDVGLTGAALVAAVVFLYYMRLRPLLLMVLTIGVGVSWTFGVTALTIGRLNIATGFLFTIITGNGINFGLLYMARYLELRRVKTPVAEALESATRDTWKPTLTAGAAAGASYGSLAITDFRGFHDFGFIGGLGMLLCWVATYWVLPPLLVLVEKRAPFGEPAPVVEGQTLTWWQRLRQDGGNFGAPFVWLLRFPRAVAGLGLVATLAGLVATVGWVLADPMEYDLLAMRTDASERADEVRVGELGNALTGHVGASGMAIVADRADQVAPLRQALEAHRDAAPADQKPFQAVHALQDYVPADQEAKIPVLLRTRRWLLKARERGAVSDADWAQVSAVLPPVDLKPFGMADLPDSLARPFTETDGTRGRIVYISPTKGAVLEDARYLFRWADSYRRTELPDGSVILGSGRAVIYADMWASVLQDVPRAVLLSLGATLLVVLLAFRLGRSSLAVLGGLVMGVAWMGGVLVLLGVRLNFLNFVALPVTFGIGVDYAVNVVQRYAREGRGSALKSVQATGGAVVLCSLTTMLGYLALVGSTNFGVRSLGIAAFIGEVCCIVASVLVLPAVLVLLDRRRAAA